jgi:integrase
VTFPYDTSYPGEALPVISVEFRPASEVIGLRWPDVDFSARREIRVRRAPIPHLFFPSPGVLAGRRWRAEPAG